MNKRDRERAATNVKRNKDRSLTLARVVQVFCPPVPDGTRPFAFVVSQHRHRISNTCVVGKGTLDRGLSLSLSMSTNTYYFNHSQRCPRTSTPFWMLLSMTDSGAPESYAHRTINSGASQWYVPAYATAMGDPVAGSIPAGTWNLTITATVDDPSTGVTTIQAYVQTYSVYGENNMPYFEFPPQTVTSSTPVALTMSYTTSSPLTFASDDVLFIQFSCATSSATDRLVTLYFEGTVNVATMQIPV